MLSTHTPSTAFIKEVRARLILRGSSLSDWSRKNGVQRQNLTKALSGDWKGPKAEALIQLVKSDLGMVSK